MNTLYYKVANIMFCRIGVLGVHLINGTNEVMHITDAIDVVFDTVKRMGRLVTSLGDPPSSCSDRQLWMNDGSQLLK